MKMILETQRLQLREFENSDFEFVIELLNMPSWLRFIGDRKVHSKQDAENYIQKLRSGYEQCGFGFWLVEMKNDKTKIGMCGLIKRENFEFADIGFAFLEKYEGLGFAYEAALATFNFATTNLKMENVCAITDTENLRSIKLLEKIGFHFEKMIEYENENLMLFVN